MRNIIVFFLIGVPVLSCKKKVNDQPPPTDMVTLTPYATSNATLFSGVFSTSSFTQVLADSKLLVNSSSTVIFNKVPLASNEVDKAVGVKGVVLNNGTLDFDSTYLFYQTQISSHLNDELWQVSGANGIPSFNYLSKNNSPGWSNFDFSSIPDSLSISAGFTIHINGVVNITSASIALVDGLSDTTQVSIEKSIKIGDNTIVFNPAELSEMKASKYYGFISIGLTNSRSLNFLGKDFKFEKGISCAKNLKFVP